MQKERKYRFFLHYNKPLSKERRTHLWTVHFRKKCYIAENIECNVITESKTNRTQPYVVMQGMAKEIKETEFKLVII